MNSSRPDGKASEGPSRLETIAAAARPLGLLVRGAFRAEPTDALPALADGTAMASVVLLGWAGQIGWADFARSPEARDAESDALDRWSRRVVGGLARAFHALPLFPSDGPPWLPFGQWAKRAEPVFSSPLGILIHSRWGLWHSYRGALGLGEVLALPDRDGSVSPCLSCRDQPCLSACPVSAFSLAGYDASVCAAHVRNPAGGPCLESGCEARRRCPVGAGETYGLDQASFHMKSLCRGSAGAGA